MDESNATCGKRLESINVENTEENRRAYRELLVTTPGIGEYISGAILFEETLYQSTRDGKKFTDVLKSQNIMPGIKVDKGLVPMSNSNNESWCQGLDGLAQRCSEYYKQGARFSKWRSVISIPSGETGWLLQDPCMDTLAGRPTTCQLSPCAQIWPRHVKPRFSVGSALAAGTRCHTLQSFSQSLVDANAQLQCTWHCSRPASASRRRQDGCCNALALPLQAIGCLCVWPLSLFPLQLTMSLDHCKDAVQKHSSCTEAQNSTEPIAVTSARIQAGPMAWLAGAALCKTLPMAYQRLPAGHLVSALPRRPQPDGTEGLRLRPCPVRCNCPERRAGAHRGA